MVFTEFIDMVENSFGERVMDDIFDACTLESGGAYTTVGTYDHRELIQIVTALSNHTDLSVRDLVISFGKHLFPRFHAMMPQFFEKPRNAFEFLKTVHGTVHVEVKKLYPDASLPDFVIDEKDERTLLMTYSSHCPFADFAEGLIRGCIAFYDEDITIETEDRNTPERFVRLFTMTT
ncbi:MAG: heme NO-binding domain-containing protein [Rhodospirillales bacterium]|nr:heme NO-binding domain-containing protein [Rhodospirillales bacterium]MCB9973504.1 heme NO-binding domain-containing protein [Rhodospirillales bacterium]